MRRASFTAAVSLLSCLSLPSPAIAQSHAAIAEVLFQEGKGLMDQKRFAEACPKLAESQRLDPGTGTLILLAACHEHEGRWASAWTEYTDALGQATQAGRKDRINVAEDGIKRTASRVARLTLTVQPSSRVTGLAVTLDGVAVGVATLGVAIPVDPGDHVIEATAPGRKPFRATVKLGAAAHTKTVEIALEEGGSEAPPPAASSAPPAVAEPSAPPSTAPTPPSDAPNRVPALVVGGVGVGALLAGGYFGLRAMSDAKRANELCPDKACADRDGLDSSESAVKSARLSTILSGLGVVGIGVGGYLWYASTPREARLTISPVAGPSVAGLSARGAF